MKFQILIFIVWVSSFSIVSSSHQYQEFGQRYLQHPDRPTHSNYAHNTPVLYPANSQFFNHDKPFHVSNQALHSEPLYGPPHQLDPLVEKDPRIYETIEESSAQNQAKSSYEYKPPVYIPQPHQELPRPYPVDKTFKLHVPPPEHVYRPDYKQHVAEPWVSQNTYQPAVHQELYHQPIVYSEPQPSVRVYQHQPPLQRAQPHNTPPPQQTQPQHSPPSQHPSSHQQTYYKPPSSYAVPEAHAPATAYATSETNVADILASKPEVKDYLESALLKHYKLDDLGNSHHVKSSDFRLEENDNDMEITTENSHNNHQNNKYFKEQLFNNVINENKKIHIPQKNNYIGNPQTVPEQTKHETVPPKDDNKETFYHPRLAYLNHKENSTEVKTFPIEVNPVNPHHYPIAKHHYNAKHTDNVLVNKQQKPALSPTPLGNTDDSYPIETQHSKIYETSILKDKEAKIYDHDLHLHEQPRKNQPEQKPYADKIQPENEYIPTIHSKIPSHSTPIDQINIENPVDKFVDTPSHRIKKPKDSFDDVSSLLFHSDPIDDTKAPLNASPNSNNDQPYKEFYSNPQSEPEVAKPTTDTYNSDVVTNPIVSHEEDPEKIIVTKIDVTKSNQIDDEKPTPNENVSDNGDEQQKGESEPRSTLTKDIAKQSSIEGSPLNADSPTDDGTSIEHNGDCTSGEIDPNSNGDDEVAADSENGIKVLLSSINLWEKLLAKQPNLEFQAFNVVTLSPIVEKTSRLFAFPNHTTVEESVETVWKCKGDALPLEIKLTTTIKNPSHDENKCD